MNVQDVKESFCDQEEADTKVFWCANFAYTLGLNSCCIVSVDTDVGILELFYSVSFHNKKLYIQLGSKNNVLILDLSQSDIAHNVKLALPGLHSLTGCDSTSSFYGKGKIKPYKLMKSSYRVIHAMQRLGPSLHIKKAEKHILEEFVCELYGKYCRAVDV